MLKYINRNERKIEEDMVQTASFEETLELYKWLQGEKMEGYEINNQPKLNKEQAFAVIYMLQEAYGFIPDTFEKCDVCGELFDSDIEGEIISDKDSNKTIICCDGCL